MLCKADFIVFHQRSVFRWALPRKRLVLVCFTLDYVFSIWHYSLRTGHVAECISLPWLMYTQNRIRSTSRIVRVGQYICKSMLLCSSRDFNTHRNTILGSGLLSPKRYRESISPNNLHFGFFDQNAGKIYKNILLLFWEHFSKAVVRVNLGF